MFSFFRKYQKIVIATVAFFIVISFAFFGIQGALTSQKNVQEKTIAILKNQDELKESDLWAMIRFLETELSFENPFNEGFITKEFLQTDLFTTIIKKYPHMQKHWDAQKERIHNFQPYKHPQGKAISAEVVWKQFSPKLWENLQHIKDEKLSNEQALEQLKNLYLEQVSFSPQMLQRILQYLQSQYQWAQKDPFLKHGNFSLFGFRNVSDWFGKDFLKIVSAYIYRYVSEVEDQVRPLSDKEIWHYLYEKLKYQYRNENISLEEIEQLFNRHLQVLGISQRQLIRVARTLLCFQEALQQLQSKVLVDLLPQEEMNQFNFTKAKFDKYVLPKDLQLHTFHDIELFEMYRMAVVPSYAQQEIILPTKQLPIQDISKNYPKLVYQKYHVSVKQVSEDDLLLQIPLNDVFSWQVEDAHWETLCHRFLSLRSQKNQLREKRSLILDQLSSEQRNEVDQFTMQQILQENPEWIDEAIKAAPERKETFRVFSDGKDGNFAHLPIVKKEKLISLIQETDLDKECIFQDLSHHYQITVLDKDEQFHLSSFTEAKEPLEQYLEQYLQQNYASIQKIAPQPFLTEKGEWKPFSQAKKDLGKYAFASLLRAIDQSIPIVFDWKEGEGPEEHYVKYRFIRDFQELKEKQSISPLKDFQLEIIEENLQSIDIPREWIDKLQQLDVGQWSEPIFDETHGMFVLNYKERLEDSPKMEAIGKKSLQNEMKQMYFEKKLVAYQNWIENVLKNSNV